MALDGYEAPHRDPPSLPADLRSGSPGRSTSLILLEMAGTAPLIVALDELPSSGGAHRFEGAEHGDLPVSVILIETEPGSAPTGLHRHPYPEIWIVERGEARFTVGDREVNVSAGHLLIGPADVPHRFMNSGAGPLRVVSIHPAARFVVQEVSGTQPVG